MIREGEIPDFIEDTAGELTDGSDPSPTPLLLGCDRGELKRDRSGDGSHS